MISTRLREQLDLFDGEYTYRCILTNDWDMTDEEIIQHYNKRGTAEQVFDRQNNDFGWAHLPKSFMNQNTVFLLITAMAANFYRYIVSLPLMCLFGVEATDRVKSFLLAQSDEGSALFLLSLQFFWGECASVTGK